MKKIIISFALFTGLGFLAQGQLKDQVKFGVVSRTYQQNNQLTQEDTVNPDRQSNGYTLMDLGVNINPDRKTEIQSIIRFKTDLAGFFGDGSQIELRQIKVKGLLRDVVAYELGDVYLQLSPFTLYNNNSDGNVNEATVFSDLRTDIAEYENFNRENYWWQQGAHANFGLEFEKYIHTLKVDGFFLRNRGTDFISVPNQFYAGGRVEIKQSKDFAVTFNYINLYDDGKSTGTELAVRNPVSSLGWTYSRKFGEIKAGFDGELGMSKLAQVLVHDTSTLVEARETVSDLFFDGGLSAEHESGLSGRLGYRYVGPEFFSAGAQSKRVRFDANPLLFAAVNNNPFSARGVTIFDLTRDAGLYNPVISRQLMAYDPRLNNAMPYGVASPNRKGFTYEVVFDQEDKFWSTKLQGAVLSDVVGEGAAVKRKFNWLRLSADADLGEAFGIARKITVKGGLQLESTSRDDSLGVSLNSALIDLGCDIEIAKKLDVLVGAKILKSSGNEFVFERNEFNELTTPTSLQIDQLETLYAFGLKYQYSDKIYLTIQDQVFSFEEKNSVSPWSYGFNQLFILFNMTL